MLATLIAVLAIPALALAAVRPTATPAAPPTKAVTFQGYRVVVPASWPVYRLAAAPATCVRFNRHAVYVGRPSPQQSCSGQPAGRTEAILVQPLGARAAQMLPATTAAGTTGSGNVAQILNRAHRVLVTATWNRHAAVIRRALDLASPVGRGAHGGQAATALGRGRSRRRDAHARALARGRPRDARRTGPDLHRPGL